MLKDSVYNFQQFCNEMDYLTTQDTERETFIIQGQIALKKLLLEKTFVCQVMEKFVTDDNFVKGAIGTIDRNDLGIFFSPKGNFSIRLFVWLPAANYPVHDHGAPGIIGGFANKTLTVNYQKDGNVTIDKYTPIREVSRQVINPGDTIHVLPFGIHHMSSLENKTSLTLHVYGRVVRKGFIKSYNTIDHSVLNLMTPKLDKRWHAIHALGAIGSSNSMSLLEKAFHDTHPLIRWTSIEVMREIDRDAYHDLLKAALRDPDEEVRAKAKALLKNM
jgi:predicted metal-dependent enzyme (double-stranded beta helix superfamily)